MLRVTAYLSDLSCAVNSLIYWQRFQAESQRFPPPTPCMKLLQWPTVALVRLNELFEVLILNSWNQLVTLHQPTRYGGNACSFVSPLKQVPKCITVHTHTCTFLLEVYIGHNYVITYTVLRNYFSQVICANVLNCTFSGAWSSFHLA